MNAFSEKSHQIFSSLLVPYMVFSGIVLGIMAMLSFGNIVIFYLDTQRQITELDTIQPRLVDIDMIAITQNGTQSPKALMGHAALVMLPNLNKLYLGQLLSPFKNQSRIDLKLPLLYTSLKSNYVKGVIASMDGHFKESIVLEIVPGHFKDHITSSLSIIEPRSTWRIRSDDYVLTLKEPILIA